MAHATTVDRFEVRHRSWSEAFSAGVAAGALGGVLMGGGAMVQAALAGAGPLFPLRLIAAFYEGPAALVGGTITVLSGLALHMFVSMVLGLIFAALVPRSMTIGVGLVAATVFALGVLAVMTTVVLPAVNPTMLPRVQGAPMSWAIQHVLFGLGLACEPLIRRRGARAAQDSQ